MHIIGYVQRAIQVSLLFCFLWFLLYSIRAVDGPDWFAIGRYVRTHLDVFSTAWATFSEGLR